MSIYKTNLIYFQSKHSRNLTDKRLLNVRMLMVKEGKYDVGRDSKNLGDI